MSAPRIVFFTTGPSELLSQLLVSPYRPVGIVANRPARRRRPLRRWLKSLLPARDELAATAAAHGIAFHVMDRGTDDRLRAWVEATRPDLIVVCGMVQLLRRAVFGLPPLGAINLHPTLLPRYRGPEPLFWAYHDMDLSGGATVHLLDDGSDTGDLLLQEGFDVAPGLPRLDYLRRAMGEIGPRLVLRVVDQLTRGEVVRTPQPRDSPTVYARRVRPDEHRALVDWHGWPIERVWHFLRGTQPWVHALDPPSAGGWVIGDYECRPERGEPGSIRTDASGTWVVLPEGRIRIWPENR